MTEKQLKTEITRRIRQGSAKSDLYKEFKEAIDDNVLRKILASRPSFELGKKFKPIHMIVCVIWVLFLALELLGSLDLISNFEIKYIISLAVSIFLTIQICNFNGHFLLPGIIWLIWSIISSFLDLYYYYEFDPDFVLIGNITIGYVIILVLAIYLMQYIRKNVFSYYKWFKPDVNHKDELLFE